MFKKNYKEKIAVYPGTFDPVTNGHIDIIKRALKIFDKLIVLVGDNPVKKPLFTVEERVDMLKKTTKNLKNVHTEPFSGLLTDFLKNHNLKIIVRGLRAVSDFDFEFQRALLNRKHGKDIETVFIMTKGSYIYLNSSIVREMAMFHGNLSHLVPRYVEKMLKKKFN